MEHPDEPMRTKLKPLTFIGGVTMELKYAEEYQQLVKAGKRPQIKKKYRTKQAFKKVRG